MIQLLAGAVAPWVKGTLLDPQRGRPVVAVTTRPKVGGTWIDPEVLQTALGDAAEVVVLETGDATWELAESLPPRLDAYGGAIRIWWPGLTEQSNPYDHKLYFVHAPPEASKVFDQIVAAIRGRTTPEVERALPAIDATVVSLAGGVARLRTADGKQGVLRTASAPVLAIVRCLVEGMVLPVRPTRPLADGTWEISVADTLPTPWQRVVDELAVDDVIVGRVQATRPFGALVEVLPRVVGLIHISELDWSFVEDVREFAKPGQLVPVKIITLDPDPQRLELSLKRAWGSDPRPLPSLVPGGRPFEWHEDEAAEPPTATAPETEELEERIGALSDELDAAVEDRSELAEQNRALRAQANELRRDLRRVQDRCEALERRLAADDPLASERAFVREVRIAYARMFDESDRVQHPLRRMRVGPEFLDSLRSLAGVDLDKVLEVCAQVASDTARDVPAREVHQLRDGPAGAPSRTRAADGAIAWRCALQVRTPSARRLHWWSVPAQDGVVIEFANVGVHDEFSIPD